VSKRFYTVGAAANPEGTTPSQSQACALFPVEHVLPFALVPALFLLFGMSNNLTDILVQQFKKSFELSPLQAQLVQTGWCPLLLSLAD